MGSRYSVYVGPYIRCVNKRAKVMELRNTCINTKCKAHGTYLGGSFCNKCGDVVKNVNIEKDGWEVSLEQDDDLDDRLNEIGDCNSEIDLWIPNIRWGQISNRAFDNETGELVDGANRDVETDSFKAFFAGDIEVLTDSYGEDSVEVKWGAIGDWS